MSRSRARVGGVRLLSAPGETVPDGAIRLMEASRLRDLVVTDGHVPIGVVSLTRLLLHSNQELERSVLDLSRFIAGPAACVDLPRGRRSLPKTTLLGG